MKENSSSIEISENSERLLITYPTSSRLEPTLLLFFYAAILAACHYFWYQTASSLFSERNAWLIPACLLGDAGLIFFFFRIRHFRSDVSIDRDGTVRQGFATWKFPGPMTALVAKGGGGRGPMRYWIELRYGRARMSLSGNTVDGQMIGLAARINPWSRQYIQGAADPFDAREAPPSSWGTHVLYVSIALFAIGAWFGSSDTFLNAHARPEIWAKISAGFLAISVVSVTLMRWKNFAEAGIRRSARIMLTEAALTILIALGSAAYGGRIAQTLEATYAPGVVDTFDAPLRLTRTTTGKGCHRYLIFNDPSLDQMIRYCDPHPLEYWRQATRVLVMEQQTDLGIHILSVTARLP